MSRLHVGRVRATRISTGGLLAASSVALVGAPMAYAAEPADAADGERGFAPTSVEAADWAAATEDPAVMAAYATFLSAAAKAEATQARVAAAAGALKRAQHTPGANDDRHARKALARAEHALASAQTVSAQRKGDWDVAIADRLAALEAAHGPSAGAGTGTAPAGPADGTYVGKVSRKNPFGDVQVTLTVTAGKVSACTATYPTEQQSGKINAAAIPSLCSAAIAAQSASIGAVGGASYTSPAFKDSLADAIRKAGL